MQRKLLLVLVLVSLLQSSLAFGGGINAPRSPFWQITDDERQWEKTYLTVPSPDIARRHLRFYTEEAHIAGSERDYQTALYTRDRLREYGIPAEIQEYYVWMPYPKELSVEMTTPTTFKASLQEDGVLEDKDYFDK